MPEYFTLAEIQALPDMAAASTAAVDAAEAYFVKIVERELDRAFVPRTITDELDGNGTGTLYLTRSDVISLTSVMVDGVSVSTALLTGRHGRLRYKVSNGGWHTPFLRGVANVTVVYSAGQATPPADIKDAVMWATRDRLLSQDYRTGSDARRTSVNTQFGTTTYVLPGEKRPTGYPELDAVIASYMRSTPSYGFA